MERAGVGPACLADFPVKRNVDENYSRFQAICDIEPEPERRRNRLTGHTA